MTVEIALPSGELLAIAAARDSIRNHIGKSIALMNTFS
jgi:hypothetical protein